MVDGWSMDGRDRILIVEKRTKCQIVTTHRLVHDILTQALTVSPIVSDQF